MVYAERVDANALYYFLFLSGLFEQRLGVD